MEPDPKRIVVRYKKLGRERVLGLADLDTYEILISPQGLSRGGMRAANSGFTSGKGQVRFEVWLWANQWTPSK